MRTHLIAHVRGNAVGYVALFVALGGGAYAATNGIPGPDGSIHACYAKRDGSLRVVPAGDRCPARQHALKWQQRGPRGFRGLRGFAGARGPSDVYSATNDPGTPSGDVTVTVPAGRYLAMAKATEDNAGGTSGAIACTLKLAGADAGDFSSATVPNFGKHFIGFGGGQGEPFGSATVSNLQSFDLPAGGTITESCGPDGLSDQSGAIHYMRVDAIKVATLHGP